MMNNSSTIFNLDLSKLGPLHYENNGKTIFSYFSILIIIGIVGNVHVLLVYGKSKTMTNYQIFVVVLAIINILICSLSIPSEIVYTSYIHTFTNVGACKCFRFITGTLVFTSVFIFALTAIERYRKICTPLKLQLTRKTVLISCGAVAGISIILASPILLLYDIVKEEMIDIQHHNGTKCAVSNDTYKSVYASLIILIVTIMFIVKVTAYSMITRVLLKQRRFAMWTLSNKNDSQNNSDSLRKNNAAIRNTITLMIVTALWYIETIPGVILAAIIKFADENLYETSVDALGITGLHILKRGYFINNIVSPIVIFIIDKKFRDGMKNIYSNVWTFLKCEMRN